MNEELPAVAPFRPAKPKPPPGDYDAEVKRGPGRPRLDATAQAAHGVVPDVMAIDEEDVLPIIHAMALELRKVRQRSKRVSILQILVLMSDPG